MFANLKFNFKIAQNYCFFLFVQENNGFIYFLGVFCAIKVLLLDIMMLKSAQI